MALRVKDHVRQRLQLHVIARILQSRIFGDPDDLAACDRERVAGPIDRTFCEKLNKGLAGTNEVVSFRGGTSQAEHHFHIVRIIKGDDEIAMLRLPARVGHLDDMAATALAERQI